MNEVRPATRRRALRTMSALAACSFLISRRAVGATDATPRQIEGPFYPDHPSVDKDLDLTHIKGHTEHATGEPIFVGGRVSNVKGEPLAGATVDVWQANHHGRYRHALDRYSAPLDEHFQGWGIVKTDAFGRYRIKTIRPGPYPLAPVGGQGWRCRHIHFKLSHPRSVPLTTQMYFSGDPLIEADAEIARAPEHLRHLLIAESTTDRAGVPVYGFDVVLADA